MHPFDQMRLQLFGRRAGRNYMMRSEKRPGYNHAPQKQRRGKKRRTGRVYLLFTLLVSILLWPVGLFMIWNRRLRCGVGGKLLWSVVTLLLCGCLFLALLTAPFADPALVRTQDRVNDAIATASVDARLLWETFSERSADAWTNLRTAGERVGNFSAGVLADGLTTGVDLAQRTKEGVESLFAAGEAPDSPEASASPEVNASPEASTSPEASVSPEVTASPAASNSPEASDAPDAGASSDASASRGAAARMTPAAAATEENPALSGLALARAGLSSGAATPSPSAKPTASATVRASSATPSLSPLQAVTQAPTEVPATSTPTATPTQAPSATATPTQAPSATQVSTASATPAVTPAPGPATARNADASATLGISEEGEPGEVAAKSAGEFLVYHTAGGRYYHVTEDCSGMRNAEAYTLSSSVADGFAACTVCGAPSAQLLEEEQVAWVDEENCYHISDECASFAGAAKLMTLEEAAQAQCTACPACNPPALPEPEPELDEEALLELAKEVTVYYFDGSVGYHLASDCHEMHNAPAHTLYEAIQAGKRRCSSCLPPTLEDLG